MNDRILDIAELLILQKERPLTEQEQLILNQWVLENPENALLVQQVQDQGWIEKGLGAFAIYNVDNSRKILESKLASGQVVPRIHFLRTHWFRYAAAIVLILCSVAYLWMSASRDEELPANGSKSLQTDIAPGGEKAILTLTDGKKVVLDSAANGNLAQQGNVRVMKLADGQVVYDLEGKSGKEVMWNTISTPAGGQYRVTLADGTKVWLNAASSCTYPTAFVGRERPVKISGEVYFEVAKNKEQPFKVDVDGKSVVEALGTSFNINSYSDEESITTTLLEGSVKVVHRTSASVAQSSSGRLADKFDRTQKPSGTEGAHLQSVILKPGEQATISAGISVSSNVDMDKALAWKNGLFNFNGSDLRSVMRQLERWYDIKVRYEGPVSDDIFKGEMYRNVNLSDVLDMLHEMDVKFRMEGKTLIVSG